MIGLFTAQLQRSLPAQWIPRFLKPRTQSLLFIYMLMIASCVLIILDGSSASHVMRRRRKMANWCNKNRRLLADPASQHIFRVVSVITVHLCHALKIGRGLPRRLRSQKDTFTECHQTQAGSLRLFKLMPVAASVWRSAGPRIHSGCESEQLRAWTASFQPSSATWQQDGGGGLLTAEHVQLRLSFPTGGYVTDVFLK